MPEASRTNSVSKRRSWRRCVSTVVLELCTRESHAKISTDGVLAFATISLALKVPRMTDPRAQGIAIMVWGGIIFGMYSFLLSVFRIKNGGYPFWLPPF